MTEAPRSSGVRQLLARFVATTFVVFLHFAPEITSYQNVRNRFFRQWSLNDAISLTLDVLLLGILITLAAQALDRPQWPRMRGFIRAIFVLGLASGIVANIEILHRPHFLSFEILWLVMAGAVGYSLGRPQSRLVQISYRFALFFSPLVPIVLIQMYLWSTWGAPHRPLRISFPKGPSRPVFVFVFDEWSFVRSAPGGQFRANLPHLRELSERSLFFRNAHSPGDDTYRSLPLLIYGDHPLEHLPLVFNKEGKRGREYVTSTRPAEPVESVFQIARSAGYNTALIGFYLPYEIMFRDSVDFARGYSFYPVTSSLWRRMLLDGLESMRYETDPVSRHMFRVLYAQVFTRNWLRLHERMGSGIEDAVAKMPMNTLTFVHFPLPHAPFIFNEDGSFRGVYPIDWHRPTAETDGAWGTEEEYQRQLVFFDRVVGGLVDRLKRAGKYDDALIIMTSDHSWRFDPDAKLASQARRWVPLMVKLPGQTRGCVVDTPFANVRYHGFVRQVLRGDAEDADVEALLRQCGETGRVDGPSSSSRGAGLP
jgi:hypothetical protein